MDSDSKSQPDSSSCAICVDHLTKKFNDFTAVDNISFSVEQGDIFAFLGPNGAGKTTTIKMLTTLLTPTGGSILLSGVSPVTNKDEARKAFGIVFQDPSVDEDLTAYENMDFHGVLYDVSLKIRKVRIQELLTLVDLWDKRDILVKTFSGGMKRRLEIARGLLHAPRVLFLDEPTIGLDPQTRNRIWEYLLKLRREYNITLFMTTHYMDEAEYCDRIAIIDNGTIIALDTPAQLKAHVRGDVIVLRTPDNIRAAQELKEKFGLVPVADQNGVRLEAPNGAELIPRLIRELSVRVEAASMSQPTLDDVFLKLTGKKIRDSDASNRERLKTTMRRMGRRWR